MGRELSELVVQLTFEHGGVASQVKQIQKEVSGMDISFRASVAAMGGFSNGLDKARAESQLFTQQLALQRQATEKLRGEMDGARAKMTDATQAFQAQTVKVTELRAKKAALADEVDALKASMDKSKAATGDNTEEYIGMSLKLDGLNVALSETDKQLKGQEQQLRKNDAAVASSGRIYQASARSYNEARLAQADIQKALDATNKKLQRHVAQLEDASKKMKAYGDRTREVGQAQSRFGQGLTAGVTAPIVAAGGASVGAAIGWESDFAGVAKTVEGTPEQLARINDELLTMTKNIPTASGDLAGIAANAGQLGIATDNVTGFTRTIADLKETTNLTAEQGAQDFAKFANITKMPQTQFGNMGSAVVALGNNFATTESDIVAMSMNLAASGTQAKMSQAQILGIATGLSSLGLEAQAGGTAFSKTITEMQVAVETGSKDLNDYAKVAGMSATEFATAFRTDAAGALSSFIAGLSSGTDSAVVMLDKMGVTETRTRDALLRASGAGSLLTDSIKMSTDAWRANVALTNEANVRYQTTQSKITMAGNAAKVAAIKFGSDFLPAIQDGADILSDMADKFGALDEATRKQIITFAGLAAAAGPAIMMIGKGNEAVASVALGVGKFTGAMAAAGGGMSGFVSALGGALGPVGVLALVGALGVAVYKWYDYASGAQAAREATEAMIKTAQKWQETQAATIYDTGNNPFERFGLEQSDFGGGVDESKDWLDRLNQTWSDGKAETKQIVTDYVNEFKGGSDKIREAIEARKKTQQKYGVTGDKTTEDDLKKLKDYDKEVEALLKKKKNGKLSEKDQKRLELITQERVEIQLKYTTGEGGGYDSISQAVEAEKARLSSEGQTPGADLYGDALKAGAQGYQTQVDAINQSYRDQYADIMSITDEKQREAALTQLNTEHQLALNKAKEDYNKLVGQYGPEAFQTPEVQQAQADMQTLTDKITAYNKALEEGGSGAKELTDLKTFTDGLDEGKLASYLALLKQLQGGGQGNVNLGEEGEPVITASSLLGGYDTVAAYLTAHAGTFEGLSGMFGAAGDESNRVLVDMGFTPEGQLVKDQLDAWSNGIPVSIIATVSGYNQATGDAMTIQNVNINPETGTVDGYDQATNTTYQIGNVNIDPERGEIIAYDQKTNTPITITGVNIDPETGDISGYNQMTGAVTKIQNISIDPETGVVTGYDQVADTMYKIGNVNINPETGVVTAYNQDTKEPIKIDGVSLKDETGTIVGYTEAPNATTPTPLVSAKLQYSDFSGIEQAAINKYFAENPDVKPFVPMNAAFSTNWADDLDKALDADIVRVWKNGKLLPLTPDVIGEVGPKDVWSKGFDENGNPTLDIILLPQPLPETGTLPAVDAAQSNLDKKPEGVLGEYGATANEQATVISKLLADIDAAEIRIKALQAQTPSLTTDTLIQGETTKMFSDIDLLNQQLDSLSDADYQKIADGVGTIVAAIQSGEVDPEAGAAALQPLLDVIKAADQYLGIGNDVSAGIASAMAAYGWTATGETVASNIETALRSAGALNSQSPAKKMVPLGNDVAAGVGQGLAAYTFTTEAPTAAANLKSAVETALAENPIGFVAKMTLDGVAQIKLDIASQFSTMKTDGKTYGQNLVNGIIQGLEDKREDAKAKAKSIADDIREIIRKAWDINSPSKEGIWLGSMLIEGVGRGMDAKIPDVVGRLNQLELKAMQPTQGNNRIIHIYEGDNNFNGPLQMNDKQDTRALAIEINQQRINSQRARGAVYNG